MDKSLFFLTLSLLCVWVVIDSAIGSDHLTKFLATLFPFISSPDITNSTTSMEQTNDETGATADKQTVTTYGGGRA